MTIIRNTLYVNRGAKRILGFQCLRSWFELQFEGSRSNRGWILLCFAFSNYLPENPLYTLCLLITEDLTYIYFHAFDRKRLDRRYLVRHEPVKFVSSFIPLDAVQVVAVQIIAAHKISAVSGLIIRFLISLVQFRVGNRVKIQQWESNSLIFTMTYDSGLDFHVHHTIAAIKRETWLK